MMALSIHEICFPKLGLGVLCQKHYKSMNIHLEVTWIGLPTFVSLGYNGMTDVLGIGLTFKIKVLKNN